MQSLSKRSAMTGYRIGWVAGDENIISAFKKLKTNTDSGTATFIQDAAIAALKDEKHVENMRADYKQKRDILVSAFTSAGLENCSSDATIYIWQKAPNGMNSVDFAKKLLQKEICVAVSVIGTPPDKPLQTEVQSRIVKVTMVVNGCQ